MVERVRYCLRMMMMLIMIVTKCRKNTDIKDTKILKTKNGRNAFIKMWNV